MVSILSCTVEILVIIQKMKICKGDDFILVCKLGEKEINCYDGIYDRDTLKAWSKKGILKCPQCGEQYTYNHGKVRIPYFKHLNADCVMYGEPETEEHIQGKIDLFEWIQKQDGVSDVRLEGWLPETKQRPDIMFKYNSKQYVIEYQCSPISSEYIERHELYQAAGIHDIWICGAENYMQWYHKGSGKKRFNTLEKECRTYYDPKNKKFYLPETSKNGLSKVDYRICHCWVKDKDEMISMNIDNIIFDDCKILPNPIFIKNKMDEFDVFYKDCEDKISKYINAIKVEYPMFDISISRAKNDVKIFIRDSVNKQVLYATLVAELSYVNKSVLIKRETYSSMRFTGIHNIKTFFDEIKNNKDYYFEQFQYKQERKREDNWFNRVMLQIKQFNNVKDVRINGHTKFYDKGILATLEDNSLIGIFFHWNKVDYCKKSYRGNWWTKYTEKYDNIYDLNILHVLKDNFSTELTGGDVNV